MIGRRTALAGAGALAVPAVARAQTGRVLRMVPQANLSSLDPIHSTAAVTRNHGFMVYDTLYGMSANLEPTPQMAEGHLMEYGGRRVIIILRTGLRFHDGEPVRARDVVASLRRWMARNPIGQKLASVLSQLFAMDDRQVQIVTRRPFPLLFHALAGLSQPPFIMPERIAGTDPFTPIEDATGSGPFRFKRDEFSSGSLVVYERNRDYRPAAGAPSLTAGAKVVHVDRVEWRIIPDAAMAGAALQQNEVDWVEQPPPEVQVLLRRNRTISVERIEPLPNMGVLRLNHLHPPFDNPAVRRALLPAIDQRDFMQAVVGTDPSVFTTGVGVYTPGSANATHIGLDGLLGPRSLERAQGQLRSAGYDNAPMRLIGPTDILAPAAMTQVAADLFRRMGFNLDLALSDWGTVVQRRASQAPVEAGGWSALLTNFSPFDFADPAFHPLLRGNGLQGWPGWPGIPKLETLRDEWFDAEEPERRVAVSAEMQRVAIDEVAFIPVGAYWQLTALRRNLVDRIPGFAICWGLKLA